MTDNEYLQFLINGMINEIEKRYYNIDSIEQFVNDVEKIKNYYCERAIDMFLYKYKVFEITTTFKYIETIAIKHRNELLLSE